MDNKEIGDIHAKTMNALNTNESFYETSALDSPKLKYAIHGDWIPDVNTFNNIQEVFAASINFLDDTLSLAADEVEATAGSYELILSKIEQAVVTQETMADNMAILAGDYGENVTIETLGEDDFGGAFDYEDGVFSPISTGNDRCALQVESVIGNGYEGNTHSLKTPTTFWSDVVAPKREAIIDNNVTTYFEYGRITSPDDGNKKPIVFNKTYEDLYCVVTLSSEDIFTDIQIHSETMSLILSSVEILVDDNWRTIITSTAEMMNTKEREANNPYAFGAGRIYTGMTNSVRLTFKNKQYDSYLVAYDEEWYNDND